VPSLNLRKGMAMTIAAATARDPAFIINHPLMITA
jgi:hypothetical protein